MSRSKGRSKVFQEQGRRSNKFRGGEGRYSHQGQIKVRKVFKQEMTLGWALKEEQEFVRVRKKKKALKLYDQRESHKLEIYLGTSLAWSPISRDYGRVIICFDSTLRLVECTHSPQRLFSATSKFG